MSYIKLCQIAAQGNPDADNKPQSLYYLEDVQASIIVSAIPSYPRDFNVEVIDWGSEANYIIKGAVIAFHSELVTLSSTPDNIRHAIYDQLIGTYPSLVM